jgi:chaperonin cofactor prefoldin
VAERPSKVDFLLAKLDEMQPKLQDLAADLKDIKRQLNEARDNEAKGNHGPTDA